jgi:hypothetical protein
MTAASGAALFLAAIANAEDGPAFELEGGLELTYSDVYDSDDEAAELSDLVLEAGLDAALHLGEAFSLNAGLVVEPSLDPVADRAFGDTGAYLEQLYLRYAHGGLAVIGGKYNPAFDSAYEVTPGIFNDDFSGDYELTEGIGAAFAYTFGSDEAGEHTFSIGAFFFDNTVLSETLGRERFESAEGELDSRNRRRFGGVGNTRAPESFAVALSGENLAGVEGLGYTLGFHHLAAGITETEDQNGYVAGASYAIGDPERFSATPYVEFAALEDFGGTPDLEVDYLTLALTLRHGPWWLAPAYISRSFSDAPLDEEGLPLDDTDSAFILSAGYDFACGLAALVSWKSEEVTGIEAQTIALRLAYSFALPGEQE